MQLVQANRNPRPLATVQQFTFNTQAQKDSDMVLQFVAEHCQFDATLDNMLQDRLVCGIHDVKVPNLTFKKAFELSQSTEAVEKNARELSQKPKGPSFVGYHQSPQLNGPAPQSPCYRCGGKQHSAQDCRFKTAEYHNCRKKGHIGPHCERTNGDSHIRGLQLIQHPSQLQLIMSWMRHLLKKWKTAPMLCIMSQHTQQHQYLLQ